MQNCPQRSLARRADRQANVPALARQRVPGAVFQRQQRGDTQPGAGADDQACPVGLRLPFADIDQLTFAQARHAQGHGAEIIDQQQVAQAQVRAKSPATQAPMVVGETENVARYRPGAGQANGLQFLHAMPDIRQIGANRLFRSRVIDGRQYTHGLESLVAPEGEARIGTADVPNQCRSHLSASSSSENTLAPRSAGLKAERRKPNSSRPQPIPRSSGADTRSRRSSSA